MKWMQRVFWPVAVSLGLVGPVPRARAEDSPLQRELSRYFPIREALAADDLDRAKVEVVALAKSADETVARAAESLAKAKDLESARATFGELSKALVEKVKARAKAGQPGGKVFVFRCPMFKPDGTWLQDGREIGNPFFGKSMLECGKLVETIGR